MPETLDDSDSPAVRVPSRRTEFVYLTLLLAGCVLPYAHAVPWLVTNGVDPTQFRQELFANDISSFFGWDVVVAVVTLLALAALDSRLRPGERVLVAAGALAGASVGLPLYLWLRQRTQRRPRARHSTGGGLPHSAPATPHTLK